MHVLDTAHQAYDLPAHARSQGGECQLCIAQGVAIAESHFSFADGILGRSAFGLSVQGDLQAIWKRNSTRIARHSGSPGAVATACSSWSALHEFTHEEKQYAMPYISSKLNGPKARKDSGNKYVWKIEIGGNNQEFLAIFDQWVLKQPEVKRQTGKAPRDKVFREHLMTWMQDHKRK